MAGLERKECLNRSIVIEKININGTEPKILEFIYI